MQFAAMGRTLCTLIRVCRFGNLWGKSSKSWELTNLCGVQIDIVIVSCSCFAPTPSMAAMIVNHFKLRRDVLTYNLSGMGCSSSLICVDMVKHLLKVLLTGDCACQANHHVLAATE